jgi:regulator of replication initiation timing
MQISGTLEAIVEKLYREIEALKLALKRCTEERDFWRKESQQLSAFLEFERNRIKEYERKNPNW